MIQDISSDGGLLESYSYSAYGERNIPYNPFLRNSSYGYRGEAHTYDNKQYLRARYYDVHAEIFIQEDSYKGELDEPLSRNRYAYVLNNPYKYSDPSGHAVTVSADGGALYSIEYANRQWGLLYSRKNYGKTKGPWEIYNGFYNGKLYKNGGWYTGNYNGYYYSGGIQKYKLSTSGGGKGTDTEPPITINDNGTISSPYIPAVITPTTPALSPTAVNTAANMIIAETAKILNINQIMLRQFLTASLREQELQLSKGRLSDRVIGLCLQFQENYYAGNTNTSNVKNAEIDSIIREKEGKLSKIYWDNCFAMREILSFEEGGKLYAYKEDYIGEAKDYTYLERAYIVVKDSAFSVGTIYVKGYVHKDLVDLYKASSNLLTFAADIVYPLAMAFAQTALTLGVYAGVKKSTEIKENYHEQQRILGDDDIVYVAPDGTASTSLEDIDAYFASLNNNQGLGNQTVPEGYYQDANGRWHRPNGQFASNEEVGLPPATKTISDGTHGNSLDYEGTNYGYKLVDRDTGEVLKYGETINPDGRYSQSYLDSINADMIIEVQGSKTDIHLWQHYKIIEYQSNYGLRPPLNLNDY